MGYGSRMRASREGCAARGFSLLEMLVSMVLTLAVLSLLYAALISFRKVHFDQSQRTDVRQSLRAGYEFLLRDLEAAGYHLNDNSQLETFGAVFPNEDASDTYRSDAITLWSNPNVGEANLVTAMAANGSSLQVDNVAGFSAGDKVWILGTCTDATVRRDSFEISSLTTGPPHFIHHASPPNDAAGLACRFVEGSALVVMKEITYKLANTANGMSDLVRIEDEGPAVLIASGITMFEFTYFDGSTPPAIITPTNALERRSLRRLRVVLTGQGQERSRITHAVQDQTFVAEAALRNFILMDRN